MTTTIADLPTWTGPAWATEHVETNGGIRWTRRPTTVVTDCPQPITPEGEPVSVAAVLVERQPVQPPEEHPAEHLNRVWPDTGPTDNRLGRVLQVERVGGLIVGR